MNEVSVISESMTSLFVPRNFEEAKSMAKNLSVSALVPKEYRYTPGQRNEQEAVGTCLIAMDMAMRLNANILMVMQNLHVIGGRPSWSSKFLIATFNTCGRFSPIQYTFVGTKGQPDYGCFAWALDNKSGTKITGTTITMQMANDENWSTKAGSKWKTMPEQMLRYRSASFLINAYAPDISMGFSTEEEAYEINDVTPEASPEQVKRPYARTKVHGAKEALIEAQAEKIDVTQTIETIESTQSIQASETVNLDTGEVQRKTTHEILEEQMAMHGIQGDQQNGN